MNNLVSERYLRSVLRCCASPSWSDSDTMMDAVPPPLDGSLRTVSDVADWHAKHNPSKPWLIFSSKALPEQLTSLSYKEVNDASHRIAHLLRPNREGQDGEVIAVILNTDTVLYVAMLLGIMRAGFVVCVLCNILCASYTPDFGHPSHTLSRTGTRRPASSTCSKPRRAHA